MRPLKRQARAAERYDGLKAGVRDLHLYLARHTLERYGAEIVELEVEQLTLISQVKHDGALTAALSGDVTRLTDLASTVGADLERDKAAAARLETTVERLRRMGSVAHERIRADEGRRGAEVERNEDLENGTSLFYAPRLGRVDSSIAALMAEVDCVLIDGTFWRDDELSAAGVGPKRAAEMGHLPQSGEAGMMRVLAPLQRQRKILIHINNTNPILNEDSAERAELTKAGIEVAYDGMDITL